MARKSFGQLMLFSKEKLHYPYKYRLYFIDINTLKCDEPSIHRFCVRSKKTFDEYELGGVYDITAAGLNITDAVLTRVADVDEDLYHSLVYLRDLIFMDDRAGKYIGLEGDAYNTADYYWDFADYKQIIEYKPDKGTKSLYILTKFFLYFLAIVLPIGIYMMTLYGLSASSMKSFSVITIPSVAILTLPLVIWMMNFIFLMGEMLILNTSSIKMLACRKYALKWAGMRRDTTISKKTKKEIITGATISVVCILICILLNIIF